MNVSASFPGSKAFASSPKRWKCQTRSVSDALLSKCFVTVDLNVPMKQFPYGTGRYGLQDLVEYILSVPMLLHIDATQKLAGHCNHV